MDRPGSRVEFQTKDYPDGLSVYVDGRFVYGGGPLNRAALCGYEAQGSGYDPGASGHELQGRAREPTRNVGFGLASLGGACTGYAKGPYVEGGRINDERLVTDELRGQGE